MLRVGRKRRRWSSRSVIALRTLFMESQSMVQEWLERRRQLGQDGRDEVWDGVYHVVPNARSEHAEVAAEVLGALRDRAKKAGLRQSTTFNRLSCWFSGSIHAA